MTKHSSYIQYVRLISKFVVAALDWRDVLKLHSFLVTFTLVVFGFFTLLCFASLVPWLILALLLLSLLLFLTLLFPSSAKNSGYEPPRTSVVIQ